MKTIPTLAVSGGWVPVLREYTPHFSKELSLFQRDRNLYFEKYPSMVFCQLKYPKCLPSRKIQCFWQHLQASLFFPTQKHFLCQTAIWNNVLTQKVHVRYVLHLYTVKDKEFGGPRCWHWIARAVTFRLTVKTLGDGKGGNKKSTGISKTMTRTLLPGLQGHGAMMLKSNVRLPSREGCDKRSAPHWEEGKRSAPGSWCSAMGPWLCNRHTRPRYFQGENAEEMWTGQQFSGCDRKLQILNYKCFPPCSMGLPGVRVFLLFFEQWAILTIQITDYTVHFMNRSSQTK